MWNNDDTRTCYAADCFYRSYSNDYGKCASNDWNVRRSCACPCQYGVCPSGYEMNLATKPPGWNEWCSSSRPEGSCGRYPYPKGHYYPDQCPCKLKFCPATTVSKNSRCIPRKCKDVEPSDFAYASIWAYKSGVDAKSPCGTTSECPGFCFGVPQVRQPTCGHGVRRGL